MQGIGVLPTGTVGCVGHAHHLVARHGIPVDLERTFIVSGVAAQWHIDVLVEDKAVGIRGKGVATRFFNAVHLVGIAPAAVGSGEIVGHSLIVLIMAVALRQFRDQDFIWSQVFSPAIDMGNVLALGVDGDVVVIDAEVVEHLLAHVGLVIVVLFKDQFVANAVSASVLHHVASSVCQVHAIEGDIPERGKSLGYRIVFRSRAIIHVVYDSRSLAGKDIPGTEIAHPVGICCSVHKGDTIHVHSRVDETRPCG